MRAMDSPFLPSGKVDFPHTLLTGMRAEKYRLVLGFPTTCFDATAVVMGIFHKFSTRDKLRLVHHFAAYVRRNMSTNDRAQFMPALAGAVYASTHTFIGRVAQEGDRHHSGQPRGFGL